MRLFIGIPLSEGTKKEISGIVNQLKESGLPIKWGKEEKWHLTLKFLGEANQYQILNISPSIPYFLAKIKYQIAKSTNECSPFLLQPEKVGYFYKGHLIVWLSVSGQVEILKKLHQKLEENLAEIGFPKEQREFQGHISIGRGKRFSSRELAEFKKAIFNLTLPKFSQFKASQINLYQSILKPEGSKYQIAEEFKLAD